jgi:23S rRNA (cytosine1962-C5)-methyltransferase
LTKPRIFRPNPKFAGKPTGGQQAANKPASVNTAAKLQPEQARMPLPRLSGALPRENIPLILTVEPSADYALIDSGDGLKLERYGSLLIVRPEGQALWRRSLPETEWAKADAVFTGDIDEEGAGRWKLKANEKSETFPMAHFGMAYLGRFTAFRHVGVFPEQASHWAHMESLIKAAKSKQADAPVRVLNLFGYTGIASLIAARAGAEVTHIDASKKAIGWARENQSVAGLDAARIRWICEDAMLFVEREARRGSAYDIILADPPAYGRGPNGEVWELFAGLPDLVAGCRDILSEKPLAFTLTSYAVRASFFALHTLIRDAFAGRGGTLESGELIIREEAAGRLLSTSMFSRWVA